MSFKKCFFHRMLRLLITALFFCIVQVANSQETRVSDDPENQGVVNKTRYWKTQWSFENVDVGTLNERLNSFGIGIPLQLDGDVTVTFDISVPLSSLTDTKQYKIEGLVRSAKIQIEGLVLNDFQAFVSLTDGVLTVSKLQATLSPLGSSATDQIGIVHAAGKLEIANNRAYAVSVRSDDLSLGMIASSLGIRQEKFATGCVDIKADASGWLGKTQWTAEGQIASPSLSVAGVDLGLIEHRFKFAETRLEMEPLSKSGLNDLTIETIKANYNIDHSSLVLSELDAKVFHGTVQGTAAIGLVNESSLECDLSWKSIQPSFNSLLYSQANVDVKANTSGSIDWSIQSNDWADLSSHHGRADITIDSIQIDGTNVGKIALSVTKQDTEIDFDVDGELFGGTIKATNASKQTPRDSDVSLRLSLFNAKISRLVSFAHKQQPLPSKLLSLEGRMSIDLRVSAEDWDGITNAPTVDVATIRLSELVANNRLLTRGLSIETTIKERTLSLRRVSGTYAGGRIEATGDYSIDSMTGSLVARVSAVDASEFLYLFSEPVSEAITGTLSARLRILFGKTIQVRGTAQATDAKIYRIPISRTHSDMVAVYVPRSNHWSVDFSKLSGEIAHGSLKGRAAFRAANRPGHFGMDSQFTFDRIDAGELLSQASGGSNSLARGQVRGNVSMSGKSISGIRDLSGYFAAKLDGSQATAFPGLSEAQRFLGSVPLARIRVEEGATRGQISGGVAQIDEFYLSSPQLKVYAQGGIALVGQRMGMEAVVSTGNFGANQAAQQYVQTALLGTLTPVGLFLQLNRFLSNRTIYVDIGGTVSRPSVRLRPLETLRDEAARYLISEILGVSCGSIGSEAFKD